MFALEIICLASAFIAVGSILFTRQSVHDVKIVGTEGSFAIAVFWEITGVSGISAQCSSYLDLKTKRKTLMKLLVKI